MKSKKIYIYIYCITEKKQFSCLVEFDAINNPGNYKTYYDIYLSGLKG